MKKSFFYILTYFFKAFYGFKKFREKIKKNNVNIALNSAKFEKIGHIAPFSVKIFWARAGITALGLYQGHYAKQKFYSEHQGWQLGLLDSGQVGFGSKNHYMRQRHGFYGTYT